MSLEAVELIMEIEEAFELTIPSERSIKMETVGDLYRYLLEHRTDKAASWPNVCLTAVTFYNLRRALLSQGRHDRAALRPDTPIDVLIPADERRDAWSRLAKSLKLKLPELRRPRWMERACWAVPLVAALLLTLVAWREFPASPVMVIGFASFAVLAFAAFVVTESWATLPEPSFATLGGLSRAVLASNLATIRAHHAGLSSADTWTVLQSIIVAQLGVDPKDVTPETSFVYDLGID